MFRSRGPGFLVRRCYDALMRTTLDLDPVVLSAARAKAQAERTSLGKAISELALAGLKSPGSSRASASGFPVLSGVPEHPVTDDLVASYRDDEPLPDDAS